MTGFLAVLCFVIFFLSVTYIFFITGRVHKLLAEKKDSALLFALFEDLPYGICVKDPEKDFTFVYVNGTFSNMLRLSGKEIIGKRDQDLRLKLFDGARCRAQDKSSFLTGATLDIIEGVRFPDGAERFFRVIKFPFSDSGGKKYIVGCFSDVTRQNDMQRMHETLVARLNEQIQSGEVIRSGLQKLLLQPKHNPAVTDLLDALLLSSGGIRADLFHWTSAGSTRYDCIVSRMTSGKEGTAEKQIVLSQWERSSGDGSIFFYTKEKPVQNASVFGFGEYPCFAVAFSEEKVPPASILVLYFPEKRTALSDGEIFLLQETLCGYHLLRRRDGLTDPEPVSDLPVSEETATPDIL